MTKEASKPAIKQLPKAGRRKGIEAKLEEALSEIKDEYTDKKFRHLLKKAGKLFSKGIQTAEKQKPVKVKKTSGKSTKKTAKKTIKKASPENSAQQSPEAAKA